MRPEASQGPHEQRNATLLPSFRDLFGSNQQKYLIESRPVLPPTVQKAPQTTNRVASGVDSERLGTLAMAFFSFEPKSSQCTRGPSADPLPSITSACYGAPSTFSGPQNSISFPSPHVDLRKEVPQPTIKSEYCLPDDAPSAVFTPSIKIQFERQTDSRSSTPARLFGVSSLPSILSSPKSCSDGSSARNLTLASSLPTKTFNSSSDSEDYEISKKKNGTRGIRRSRKRCNCEGCLRKECGCCKFCLDKKKYGGNEILKQRCVRRKCKVHTQLISIEDQKVTWLSEDGIKSINFNKLKASQSLLTNTNIGKSNDGNQSKNGNCSGGSSRAPSLPSQ